MYKVQNVISISSDEEEEEKKNAAKPAKVDEVTLTAITNTRKRKQAEGNEDDLVVVEVPDKEPLEEVTTHYENQNHLIQTTKKPEKTVIDLLSEEEEDEEIIFRPVTLSPKSKRIKPTQLNPNTVTTRVNNNDEPVIMISADDLIQETSKENIAVGDSLLKRILNPRPVDIFINNLKDTTNDIGKDNLANGENVQTLLNVSSGDDPLNDSLIIENNGADLSDDINNDDDDGDDAPDTSYVNNEQAQPSTSKVLDKSPEANLQRFKTFLRICGSKITESKTKKTFREKHNKFLKSYKTAGEFVNTADFQSTLSTALDAVKGSGNGYDAVKEVMKVYKELKENRLKPVRSLDEEEKLDHLYELLKQFTDKIKNLESVEVDYEDEDNSSYCQLQTYRAKAVKVHERICEREKKSKYLDRITYMKLDFDRSSYQLINIAINKKYKNNSIFPTFDDLNRLIRKTVATNQIELTEMSLKEEIKTCFVLLGELLQRRRRNELLDSLTDYVDHKTSDPALKDIELDRKLRENKRIAHQKTEEIVEKYCKIQESGCEPDLSSDPDDSNVEPDSSSDVENN